MAQQITSSPASLEELVENPVLETLPNTQTFHKSNAGTLSLERCIEIYKRTKRCNHLHTEDQFPYGCGVKLVACIVCPKILEKIPL